MGMPVRALKCDKCEARGGGTKSRSIPTVCGWSKNNSCKVKRLARRALTCRPIVCSIHFSCNVRNNIRILHLLWASVCVWRSFLCLVLLRLGFFCVCSRHRLQCEPLPFRSTAGTLKSAEIEQFDKNAHTIFASMWRTATKSLAAAEQVYAATDLWTPQKRILFYHSYLICASRFALEQGKNLRPTRASCWLSIWSWYCGYLPDNAGRKCLCIFANRNHWQQQTEAFAVVGDRYRFAAIFV